MCSDHMQWYIVKLREHVYKVYNCKKPLRTLFSTEVQKVKYMMFREGDAASKDFGMAFISVFPSCTEADPGSCGRLAA